ncbi:MAG: hypothetical protein ACR2F1_00945 [Nitrososphaeraceae archaeon]
MTLQYQPQPLVNEIESGLDFILNHFEEPLYPRKISTFKSNNKQVLVRSRKEIIDSFIDSNFVDCRINAYPCLIDYKDVPRYKPNFLFFDLDRNSPCFKTDRSFELALYNTVKNIREKLGGYPTVLFTGGGYHIYQPVYCKTALENVIQFNEFDRPSEQFIRFAKDNLSHGKADKNNNPSLKSCLLRIPGSINGKCLVDNRNKRLSGNFRVKILQKWNGVRPNIPRELLYDFHTYLNQKKSIERLRYSNKIRSKNNKKNHSSNSNNNNNNNNNYYDWIETKILQNVFSDYRKLIVGLILVPYLIVLKKLPHDQSYRIIYEWLLKCTLLRPLDFDPKYLINNNLKISMKKLIPPISIYKLERNYRNLYLSLLDQNNTNNNNNNNNTTNNQIISSLRSNQKEREREEV